jgi:uncharacterized Zn-finger protein
VNVFYFLRVLGRKNIIPIRMVYMYTLVLVLVDVYFFTCIGKEKYYYHPDGNIYTLVLVLVDVFLFFTCIGKEIYYYHPDDIYLYPSTSTSGCLFIFYVYWEGKVLLLSG